MNTDRLVPGASCLNPERANREKTIPPNIPFTFVNAIFGTSLLLSDLYFRDIKPGNLAVSTGIVNLVSAPLGGLPMCHGSSGVASHYKFGARTGGSNIIMGVVLIMAVYLFQLNSWYSALT
ncbi:MAG: putative sulfate/molybdate transporter [ANME-2 cluster archaeon]|nr:putative sulfate/molybdate transporter [ANME-2 cluster archaeon]